MLMALATGSLLGATLLQGCANLPSLILIKLLLLGSTSGLGYLIYKHPTKIKSLFILALVWGLSWSAYQANQRLNPMKIINKLVAISGTVVGVVNTTEWGKQFDCDIKQYDHQELAKPLRARLRLQTNQSLFEGAQISGMAKLKSPIGLANPGGFDQEKQWFVENIQALGTLQQVKIMTQSQYSLNYWRQALNQKLANLLPDSPFIGILQALTLGIRTQIHPLQWEVFQKTGTSHMVAISGLHIGLVAMLLAKLTQSLVRRYPKLTNRMPAQYYGLIAALIGAAGYTALSGFGIPAQRAFLMVLAASLALVWRQPITPSRPLAFAALIIVLLDPLAVLQMSFWLSFGCVVALSYGKHLCYGRWQNWFAPQWITFVGLLPLSLLFFKQVAPWSALANLITVPLMSLVVVPISLLAVVLLMINFTSMASVTAYVAEQTLRLVWWILSTIAHLPLSLWYQDVISSWQVALALLGVMVILAPAIPGRRWGWCLLLPLLMGKNNLIKPNTCRFTLLDVGQGLAAVIQTKHHTLLYDTGPQYSLYSDAGLRVIHPFLLSQQIKKLDKVIVSHADLDHRGGLASIQSRWQINELLTSQPQKITQANACEVPMSWEWDGVIFTLLGPLTQSNKTNNQSCVLQVAVGQHRILLTGDIEKSVEQQLIARWGSQLKSDILMVPHHGSLSSSSVEFINQVKPRYALYAAGANNRFKLPKAEVLSRYEAIGATNLVTWQQGAISFELNAGQDLTPPRDWRHTKPHYWHYKQG